MTSLTNSRRTMLLVLHLVFALTAVADAVNGPMLPSLARWFRLSDSQSGSLLFWIFAGMATGALLSRGNYARVLLGGLLALTVTCTCFPWIPRAILYPFAFLFGISVGAPMTAVSLFAGRNFPTHRASILTMLNFTWSAGAMLAPLIAARLLSVSTWRAVFVLLACASGLATIVVGFTIRDTNEQVHETQETSGLKNLRVVALFAFFFFLEVGMETMFGAWISTYVLRVTHTNLMLAAATTAVYWTGFLVSRGLSSLILLRLNSGRLLRVTLPLAFGASILLVESRSALFLTAAILLLGASLAPTFPVALAAFFDRARHSSDSRFVLALSGFGASLFPWLAGSISSRSGLGAGLLTGPMTLLIMTGMLPFVTAPRAAAVTRADASGDGSSVGSGGD
jgi:MFS transporter, FHS family, glucose/mannose:H+ symporter